MKNELDEGDFVQSCVQALLGLSNIVSARPYFTLPLPFVLSKHFSADNVKKGSDVKNNTGKDIKRRIEGERVEEIDKMTKDKNEKEVGGGGEKGAGGGKDDAEGTLTAIHVVLQIMKSKPYTATANCIGLLMNACLETSTDDSTARSTVKASSASPSSSTSTSTSASTSASMSSPLSVSHPVPLSVREVVASAGGAILGLTGVRMTALKRTHFFNFEAPEG